MLRVVPNMARHVSTALAVLSGSLALLTFASVGHAQLTVTVNAVQDRYVSTRPLTSPYLFSKVECDGAKELDLTIAGIPTGSSVLDFWSGTGCDQVEPRTSTTSSACTYLFSLTSFSTPSAQFWGGGTISTCSAVPGARRAGGAVGAALAGLMLVGLGMRVRRSRSVR